MGFYRLKNDFFYQGKIIFLLKKKHFFKLRFFLIKNLCFSLSNCALDMLMYNPSQLSRYILHVPIPLLLFENFVFIIWDCCIPQTCPYKEINHARNPQNVKSHTSWYWNTSHHDAASRMTRYCGTVKETLYISIDVVFHGK